MPDNNRLDDIFTHARPIEDEEAEFIADLAGYQVTKAELSRTYASRPSQSGQPGSGSIWLV